MKLPSLIPTVICCILVPAFSRAQDDEDAAPPTLVAVDTAKVVRATLRRRITAYGVIEPEPAGQGRPPALARLSPAVSGIVTEAGAVEGQHVKKGELLFRLDSRAAEAEMEKAEMAVKFAEKNEQRQEKLIAAEGTSEKRLFEVKQVLAVARADLASAKVNLSLLRGEAPLSGTLTKYFARAGEAANTTTLLAEIIDLDRLVASIRVPRIDTIDLKPGQTARLRASGGESPVAAVVSFVGPQANPATDTVPARLAVPKTSGLRPGQFVAATIVVGERPDRLAVPREAVYTDPDGRRTLLIVTDGVARRVGVEVGLRDGNLVEVEGGGIKEGTTVVTLGSYALPEETRIRPSSP